jgi:thioredoxin-like negative regulator of GroEL
VIGALALVALASGPVQKDLRWEHRLDQALAKAKAMEKPVLVDFWAEWCDWCHRLDETTYADPTVRKLLADFVTVKIDTEGGEKGPQVAAQYEVDSLPTIVFLSPTGRLLLRVTGYQGPGQFPETLAEVKEIASKVAGWESALDRNPNDPVALQGLGMHLFDQELLSESGPMLDRARSHDDQRPTKERKHTRAVLGAIAMQERHYNSAEAVLKEALALPAVEDYDPLLLFILGRVYLRAGRLDDARVCFKSIIDAHAGSSIAPKARTLLAELDKKP